MANRKQSSDNDFAETEVLPTHLRPDRLEGLDAAAAEAHGRYEEYVRSLDDVPVLVDIVREPPRVGNASRSDAVVLREQHADNVAAYYAEYVEIGRALTTAERAPPRHVAAHDANEGAQEKRAKRVKRSARSKS
ncbi:MAG TPA: hypothetical protein VGL98_19170 [Gammaproteobacteria bacterium]